MVQINILNLKEINIKVFDGREKTKTIETYIPANDRQLTSLFGCSSLKFRPHRGASVAEK